MELTDEERRFLVLALNEYRGPAGHAYQLLCPVVGEANKEGWIGLLDRLTAAIESNIPMSDLDWARALFLSEIAFASDLVGSALDLERGADERRLKTLRALQYKLSSRDGFQLLLQNASYPPVD